MNLNESNYFSQEASQHYMSASQLKRFMLCESLALAEIRGDFIREETTSLLVGGFVDAHFSGTLSQYTAAHPQIYTNKGTLRADFQQALELIDFIQADPLMMAMMQGDLQRILTGEIAGVPFRGKLDVLLSAKQCRHIATLYPDLAEYLLMADGAIVDLKIMRDLNAVFVPGAGRQSFIAAWQYDLQLAIYQELISQKLPCFILAATKEKQPDKALIHIPQYMLDAALSSAESLIPRYQHLKSHPEEATACGQCDWCRQTKMLTGAVDADDLEGALL